MRRLGPGSEITLADGRRMLVESVVQLDGLTIVHWRQVVVEIKAAA